MEKLTYLDIIALIILIIGGLNWGLVGVTQFDLVSAIFGVMSVMARLIYALVGISAFYGIYLIYKLKDSNNVIKKKP